MVEALAILFLLWGVAYLGWFFGRLHEAQSEQRDEARIRDAYEWAVRTGRLRSPENNQ